MLKKNVTVLDVAHNAEVLDVAHDAEVLDVPHSAEVLALSLSKSAVRCELCENDFFTKIMAEMCSATSNYP